MYVDPVCDSLLSCCVDPRVLNEQEGGGNVKVLVWPSQSEHSNQLWSGCDDKTIRLVFGFLLVFWTVSVAVFTCV